MNIRIPRKKILTALWLTSVVLIVLSVTTQIYKLTVLNGTHNFLTVAFNLDREYNIPTFFTTLMLLTCSVLLVVIGEAKRDIKGGFRWHWTVLGIIFFYLASDEILGIHERATGPVRDLLHVGGLFYFALIIPAGIIVLVTFVLYFKFLGAQPARFRRLFILAGVIYVFGVIGIDIMWGGVIFQSALDHNILSYDEITASGQYLLAASVEESLEMFGIILFIHALLSYIENSLGKVTFKIE